MHIKDCYASSSPNFNEPGAISIQLTDYDGCIVKEKLIGPFVYTKTAGSQDDGDYTLLAIAFLQAFKFPDVMDVYLTCNVEICKEKCNNPCQYFYESRQIEGTTPSYPPYDNPSDGGRPQFGQSTSSHLDSEAHSSFGFSRNEIRASTVDYVTSPSPLGVGPSLQPHLPPVGQQHHILQQQQQQQQQQQHNNHFLPHNVVHHPPGVHEHQGLLFAPGKGPGGQRPLPINVNSQPQTLQQNFAGPKQFSGVPVNVHPSVFQQGPVPQQNGPVFKPGQGQFPGNNGQHIPSRSIRPPPLRNGRAPHFQGGVPFTFASPPHTSPSPVYPGPGALPQLPLQNRQSNVNHETQIDGNLHQLGQQTFFPQHRSDDPDFKPRENLAVFLQARKLNEEGLEEPAPKKDFVQAAAGFKPNNNPYGDNKGHKKRKKKTEEEQLSRSRRTVDVPLDEFGKPERQGNVRVTRSINVIGPSDVKSLASLHDGSLYLQESDLLPPDTCVSASTFATTLSMLLAALFAALVWVWALRRKAIHGKVFVDIGGGVTAYSKS